MSNSRLPLPLSSVYPILLAGTLLWVGCGDSGATSATGDPGTTADTTSSGPSSTDGPDPTDGPPTTGSSTDASTSGNTDSGATSTGTTEDSGTTAITATTSDTTAGTTGDTTAGTTGDTTGDTTTGGLDELPTSCLDGDFPVVAPLCGADGPACALRRDELASAKPAFRNDMPALALRGDCGPALLFSEAVGGYTGFYGERTGANAWTVEKTPMPVATGSLESDPGTDEASAVVDDGSYGVSLWRRSAGAWKQVSALVGMNHARAPQLARDGKGVLHLGHIDADQHALIERFDGAWSKSQVDTAADIHVRLALDAAAAPRITYWSSKEATWKLYFTAPPAAPEPVMSLQSNVLERAHTSLALAGPDAVPWVWAARKQKDQLHHDLVLLHRIGPAKWSEETLVAETPATDKTCDTEPGGRGQICVYDYVRLYPLALFTAAAEVRAVYTAIHYQGTMVADCKNMPFPICVWLQQTDTSTAELRIGWPGGAPEEHAVIASDVFTDRATGRLDPGGYMHLAFHDQAPGTSDPVVRYLAIGP